MAHFCSLADWLKKHNFSLPVCSSIVHCIDSGLPQRPTAVVVSRLCQTGCYSWGCRNGPLKLVHCSPTLLADSLVSHQLCLPFSMPAHSACLLVVICCTSALLYDSLDAQQVYCLPTDTLVTSQHFCRPSLPCDSLRAIQVQCSYICAFIAHYFDGARRGNGGLSAVPETARARSYFG